MSRRHVGNRIWDAIRSLFLWMDTSLERPVATGEEKSIDWLRTSPFIVMHFMPLAVIWVGWSWVAVGVAAFMYALRMFAITGFYHRYFSHKTFKTSRVGQFIFGVLGSSATQRGPLWWAAHHRHHHKYSDQPGDAHSPVQHSFFWSHMGWFMARENFRTQVELVPDLERYPEIRFLDRFDMLVPVLTATSLFFLGVFLNYFWPQLGTSGAQMLIWGFFVSTVVLFHATVTINSLSHVFGSKKYPTGDESRNNVYLSFLTFGEGWHNNHHYYPYSARQGFRWWQVDITYYGLLFLKTLGIIWDVRPVPDSVAYATKADFDSLSVSNIEFEQKTQASS